MTTSKGATSSSTTGQALAGSALRLLQFEAEIRQLTSVTELYVHASNQLRKLIPYGQAVVMARGVWGQFNIVSATHIAELDGSSPLLQALKKWVNQLSSKEELTVISLDEIVANNLESIPHENVLWLPFLYSNDPFSTGVVLLADHTFTDQQIALLQRISNTYAHALKALQPRHHWRRLRWLKSPWSRWLVVVLIIGGLCIPVRLSVMAPVEVVAADPFVVSAPFSGVVRRILVPPNSNVEINQSLLQFEDIQPRNESKLAQQRLAVANARLSQVSAAAFNDNDAAHELAVVQSEYRLALLEAKYAAERLERSTVSSPLAGLAIYTDRQQWEGRAVQVGEQIMQVADPRQITYHIDLPVADAIALDIGDPVSVYLDSSPFGGHQATLTSISYATYLPASGIASYQLIAKPTTGLTPRIGARGTARISHQRVPLFWQLLRRPINALRQWWGI